MRLDGKVCSISAGGSSVRISMQGTWPNQQRRVDGKCHSNNYEDFPNLGRHRMQVLGGEDADWTRLRASATQRPINMQVLSHLSFLPLELGCEAEPPNAAYSSP
jgi:hypothetical protein